MKITTLRTSGLGDATYLLDHDGVGVLVDPQRDVERFLDVVADAGVALRFVLETHIHNDYVSGGREVARQTGAELVIPASAAVAFDHRPAFHMEELDGGELHVRPIHTPGHTPEHMSYLVLIDDVPMALFSGGSLLVGSAGRSDLLGFDRAEQLARLQYGSVRRLAALPDDVGLYPTHGEGSFCTATGAGRTTSTIGAERATNPVLQYDSADSFVAGQLAGLQPYPAYYAHMGPINLAGPTPMPAHPVREVGPADVDPDAAVVDIRPRASQAAGRIPGSVSLEYSDQVGVWSGWLLPFDTTVVIAAEPGQAVADVAAQFGRIGFDHVAGVTYDLSAWAAGRGGLRAFGQTSAADLTKRLAAGEALQVLDVRAPDEWDAGHIEGATWRYVPDIADGVPPEVDRDREVYVICRTGYRATIASGMLQDAGYRPVAVTSGGVAEVLAELRAGVGAG